MIDLLINLITLGFFKRMLVCKQIPKFYILLKHNIHFIHYGLIFAENYLIADILELKNAGIIQ